MKFLVLALCVYAASAASFGSFGSFGTGAYKPYQYKPAPSRTTAKASVQVLSPIPAPVYQPAKFVAPVVPVPAPVPFAPVPVAVAPVPVVPAVKNYNNNNEGNAEIIKNESEVGPDGYKYSYETNNGIVSESAGTLKRVGESDTLVIKGSYKYYAPDGTPVIVNYIADEKGYQPQGDVIPVAPPIPEDIARSLIYIASHPQPEYKTVKQY